MAGNDIEKYIEQLKGFAAEGKDNDLYSLKSELIKLDKHSSVFDEFERESFKINKETLKQIKDISSLMRLRSLIAEIKNKKAINNKLHSLHFNLSLFKNTSFNNFSSLKKIFDSFLYDDKTKIDNLINELNDFKAKIDEIKDCHSRLLPKSLDNKLEIENKSKYIDKIYSIHKMQKNALISVIKLFLKLTKKQLKSLKTFKKGA